MAGVVDLLAEHEENLAEPVRAGTIFALIVIEIVQLGGQTENEKGKGRAD